MKLSRKQALSIRESTQRLNLWAGAVRSGKTFASLLRWAQFAGSDEAAISNASPLVMIGKTVNALKRNVLETLSWLLGPQFSYSLYKQEGTIMGRPVLFFGANDERAEAKIRGLTAAGAYVDELTTIPESFFGMLLSRLSVPGAKLFATTNPDSPGHWVKKNYIDRVDLSLAHWHFVMADNPSLAPEYVEAISREYVGLWYRRFILGEWCAAEGAIFDFFEMAPPYVIDKAPQATYYLASCDYGTTNPCVFQLFGVGGTGVRPAVWLEREYYWDSVAMQRQKTDEEYVKDFRTWLDGVYPVSTIIDPSAASFHLALSQAGYATEAANNDVLNGIRNMSRMLKGGELAIVKDCKHTIDEISGYSWDPKAQAKGEDKPIKLRDHGVDSARYLCLTRFAQSNINYELFNKM